MTVGTLMPASSLLVDIMILEVEYSYPVILYVVYMNLTSHHERIDNYSCVYVMPVISVGKYKVFMIIKMPGSCS